MTYALRLLPLVLLAAVYALSPTAFWLLVADLVAIFIAARTIRRFGARPLLFLIAPWLALDCALNCIVFGGSWRNTMSGEAWHHRNHKRTGWCHLFIDALFWFQPGHCRLAAMNEGMHGGAWPAFVKLWKRG